MIRYSSRPLSPTLPWATGEGRILHLLFLALYLINNERIGGTQGQVHALESFYSNVTLKANNGDMSVVIYLPRDLKPGERTYYQSSRLDWGSMIGSITRTTTNPNTGVEETQTLYGTNQWRLPHDPFWAESGVGLASEFGVGTDGSLCNFLCGWNQKNEVTNGVLGYQEAKSGESFLKIGVGELVKGSCGTCDSAEDYKFNSPYQFARPPVWTLEETDDNNNNSNSVILSHKAVLKQNDRQVGYKLEKRITLNDDQLLVKNVLTNLGSKAFSTAWYSHHFFTCDLHPVQRGYSVDVDLASTNGDYNEPTTWSWSTPLEDYASLNLHNSTSVRIDMQRGVESNVRIRAEFEKDEQSKGEFTLRACDTKIRETIPEVGDGSSGISMYAYNLYIESGTFSPEPQILLHLNPGESTSWTQQLDFEDNYPIVVEQKPRLPTKTKPSALLGSGSLVLQQQSEAKETASNSNKSRIAAIPAMALAIAIASIAYRSMVATTSRTRGRKQNYRLVPDAAIDDYPNYNRDDNDIESDAI
jgi:hypothetical protein